MTITAAFVLFAVTWFMVFFCVLPIRFQSQADVGDVVAGTPKSAPATEGIGKKARLTSVIAVVVSVALYLIITSGVITLANMDVFGIMDMTPPQSP
jgi:predicted secreted protein